MFGAGSLGSNFGRLVARGLGGLARRGGGRRPASGGGAPVAAAAATAAASTGLAAALLRAGLISGSLSLAGDLAAQLLPQRTADAPLAYDAARGARMGTFGLCLYGPYQHLWYGWLDRAIPARSVPAFAAKVAANQLLLAPIVVGGVFAWTLALQGRLGEWPAKARADFVPTLAAGWRFWVPAATVNFVLVPLRHQVLYMSVCGVVWTAILSAAQESGRGAAAAPPAKAKKR
jgi:protein Mpv17